MTQLTPNLPPALAACDWQQKHVDLLSAARCGNVLTAAQIAKRAERTAAWEQLVARTRALAELQASPLPHPLPPPSEAFLARERYRQALADAGHSEATVYGHWVLQAYDAAQRTAAAAPKGTSNEL